MIGGGIGNKLSEGTLASAATIEPTTDLVRLTGNTSVATITPPRNGGFSGILIIVPVDNNVGLLTTGNIALAVTMPTDRATLLVYSKTDSLWYPGAIS